MFDYEEPPVKLAFGFVSVCALIGFSPNALAWGNKGHALVNETAADLMTSPAAGFFKAHKTALGRLGNVPDVKWKDPATYNNEKPLHFFSWDRYSTSGLTGRFDEHLLSHVVRKLGGAFVKENGSAIWRISSIQKKMTEALRAQNWEKALQMAGVLGHYMGDLAQPMHMSSDYDGQSIGRRGIHRYFETTLVNEAEGHALTRRVLEAGADHRSSLDAGAPDARGPAQEVTKVAFEQGMASYEELPEVLGHFDESSQDDDKLTAMAKVRMGQGAAALAKIWDLAVEESGITSGFPRGSIGDVADPEWFPLEDMPAVQQDNESRQRNRRD
jgi:hypothetical protein